MLTGGLKRIVSQRRYTMKYTVSKDEKSGMWYVHAERLPHVPVFGSFRKTKRAAMRIAAERNTYL